MSLLFFLAASTAAAARASSSLSSNKAVAFRLFECSVDNLSLSLFSASLLKHYCTWNLPKNIIENISYNIE